MEQSNIKYFDSLGDKFDEYMSDYDVSRRQYLIFVDLLKLQKLTQKKVLEVGCGTGRFSEQIVDLGANLTVIDIGQDLVEKVCERVKCTGVVGDACNLPFDDETFEFVISSECIEHTSDPIKAITEMCRVCTPGGTICITTPNKLWYPVLLLSQKLAIRKFSGLEHWIYPCTARKVLRKQGFCDIKLSGCHLWPFQIKFSRKILTFLDRKGKYLYPFMINFGIMGGKSQKHT